MALSENLSVDSCFEQAAAHLTEIAYSLDSNTLLYFYARYKQATVGPCNVSKPGIFDVSGRKKWWAWHDLGNMPVDEAQKQYIDKLQELNPAWKPSNEKQRSVYVSRMINLDPNSNESPLVSDTGHPIFNIIKQNDLGSLNCLLSANSNEVHSTDENGMTPLHWASDRGFSDLVSTLIRYNANINAKDAEGQTPLHYACSCGHDEVIQVLLKSNADIYAKDNEGNFTYDLYDGDFHTLFNDYLHRSTS
uniref:Acyl-CoA-binding domain-containing protein 6 n=2 Tax=Schistosoma mansoni TaxID=6183 RepID=A0A5K4FBL1_SCHMA